VQRVSTTSLNKKSYITGTQPLYSPLEDRDGRAVDDELAVLVGDLAVVAAVGGVILEHVDLGRTAT